MRLAGIHAALIAAYDDHGELSLERQAELIDHVLGQGVDGLFVSGSTGEAYLQSADERRATITAAVEQVAGRGPVIAHTGCLDTRTSLSLTEHAAQAGADAVSAVTPIYYNYDEAQLAAYFRELSAAAGPTPLIAYHIPGRSHVDLSPDFFLRLADEGILQGLKYTSTDLHPLVEIIRQSPPDFVVFNGSDEVLLGGLALGADGGIGSTYNVIGGVYRQLADQVADGDFAAALRRQGIANEFIAHMGRYDFLLFLRQALRRAGIETGHGRAPLPAITDFQRREIDDLLSTLLTQEHSS
ncbi:dihydrodipicolinate synthase family protein [Brachybacterium sp. ACRRE]|uniref:dihydrodipicolinate synthase family protein n=1 Tax=Brachybacterium sp. ACRRE TaxID=2918184 RepID=UPI001EF1BE03|nr:dihydrodipicolinate synthase family protein [Brachybacterium sp. ACRRE]MCG7311070.1 dihydrodipicolinate synthase family protein [Brachybacterium sp. ACRRE]